MDYNDRSVQWKVTAVEDARPEFFGQTHSVQESLDKDIALHPHVPDCIEKTLSKWFELVPIVLELLLD